jgi:hypothetical protein
MSRQLLLVHGRAQQQKDSIALKAEWLDALQDGLAKSDLSLPIPETDVRFPFFGDTLYDMVEGKSSNDAAKVIVRGDGQDTGEREFIQSILTEIKNKAAITDAQVLQAAETDIVNRGPLNWEWLQGILKAIDRYVPHGSGESIALFTHDVYQYLKNSGIRDSIDDGVAAAVTPGIETIVVSHSLGTVVAYNVLRQRGNALGWKIPLFVTVGSPLAVTEIRKAIRSLAPIRCPECASAWFNAMDERDVVALYPLDPVQFPLAPPNPAIENKTNVRNKTENRHGIGGYLDDKEVARRIYDALIA